MSSNGNGQKPPLCGLDEAQVSALQNKLDPDAVKTREGKFDYIEAHHAIREANRIFGPAGWIRDSSDMRLVHEGAYEGKKSTGVLVAYACRVTVRVRTEDGWVASDGWGYGEGISYNNPGQAHESAVKEAESDAMKRALVKFGDPFGLALYDKQRENVATPEEVAQAAHFDENDRPIDKEGFAYALFGDGVPNEQIPVLAKRAKQQLESEEKPTGWSDLYDRAALIYKTEQEEAKGVVSA